MPTSQCKDRRNSSLLVLLENERIIAYNYSLGILLNQINCLNTVIERTQNYIILGSQSRHPPDRGSQVLDSSIHSPNDQLPSLFQLWSLLYLK